MEFWGNNRGNWRRSGKVTRGEAETRSSGGIVTDFSGLKALLEIGDDGSGWT